MNGKELFWFLYIVIGLCYYLINIFVRKLHTKNEPGDGWILVPFWICLWWLCLIFIIAAMFDGDNGHDIKRRF